MKKYLLIASLFTFVTGAQAADHVVLEVRYTSSLPHVPAPATERHRMTIDEVRHSQGLYKKLKEVIDDEMRVDKRFTGASIDYISFYRANVNTPSPITPHWIYTDDIAMIRANRKCTATSTDDVCDKFVAHIALW